MTLLEGIIAIKREDDRRRVAAVPLEALPTRQSAVRDFRGSLSRAGYDAALIGTALLKSGDPEQPLRRFLTTLDATEVAT